MSHFERRGEAFEDLDKRKGSEFIPIDRKEDSLDNLGKGNDREFLQMDDFSSETLTPDEILMRKEDEIERQRKDAPKSKKENGIESQKVNKSMGPDNWDDFYDGLSNWEVDVERKESEEPSISPSLKTQDRVARTEIFENLSGGEREEYENRLLRESGHMPARQKPKSGKKSIRFDKAV